MARSANLQLFRELVVSQQVAFLKTLNGILMNFPSSIIPLIGNYVPSLPILNLRLLHSGKKGDDECLGFFEMAAVSEYACTTKTSQPITIPLLTFQSPFSVQQLLETKNGDVCDCSSVVYHDLELGFMHQQEWKHLLEFFPEWPRKNPPCSPFSLDVFLGAHSVVVNPSFLHVRRIFQ
jgi:hypothetical protein